MRKYILATCHNCGAVWETVNVSNKGIFLIWCPICSEVPEQTRIEREGA